MGLQSHLQCPAIINTLTHLSTPCFYQKINSSTTPSDKGIYPQHLRSHNDASKKKESFKSLILISCFHRAFFKVSHFYWPTNALNCTYKTQGVNLLEP